jgi:hypothetical protein
MYKRTKKKKIERKKKALNVRPEKRTVKGSWFGFDLLG